MADKWNAFDLVEAFQLGGPSADAISQNILWHLRRYVGMAKRTDDVTMIVARIL